MATGRRTASRAADQPASDPAAAFETERDRVAAVLDQLQQTRTTAGRWAFVGRQLAVLHRALLARDLVALRAIRQRLTPFATAQDDGDPPPPSVRRMLLRSAAVAGGESAPAASSPLGRLGLRGRGLASGQPSETIGELRSRILQRLQIDPERRGRTDPPPPPAGAAEGTVEIDFRAAIAAGVSHGTTVPVEVAVSREPLPPPPPETASASGRAGVAADGRLLLRIVPRAGFQVRGEDRVEIDVPAPGELLRVTFHIAAVDRGGELSVLASQDGQPLASLEL